jgi:hypothetical protein
MSDADDSSRDAAAPSPMPQAQAAAVRDAVEEITRLFGGGAGAQGFAGNPFEALKSLSDPSVRERLREAMQTLQSVQGSQVSTSVTTIDLRGTEAGQALRQALQGLAGGGAQVFVDGGAEVVSTAGTTVIESQATPLSVVAMRDESETLRTPPARPQAAPMQPSIVEEGGGGLFGWLGRLFGGRR